jgi:hypothetical protein
MIAWETNVRRALSLPTARDALAQKDLDAPKERVMGARKATGLRRRMEGMVGLRL